MALKWLVFLLLLIQVTRNLAVPDHEYSIEMRLRQMEKDFSLSIKTLKSELEDTKDKLKYMQGELDWTKSAMKAVNLELLATRTDLNETRIRLQEAVSELQHGRQDTSYSYERTFLASEPQSIRRPVQSKRLATRSHRVSGIQLKKAFSAQTSQHDVSLVTHQTVLFQHVILNEGSVYDNLTGVFTCPESGVYHFSVTIMVFFNEQVETELVVNGNQVMVNYAAGNQRYNQGTNSVLVRLDFGDRVWVRIYNNPSIHTDGAIRIHGYGWSTFTGFLI
ncbi:uncharacterized protein LOC117328158 [Pecten maximus]|uniref:uncharacterized protein LOC117328158 n=1 Tax=Pecten maximus TaxID=6579 RepID=UPI0014583F7E|nr:uncharacterized protein LOC117328158 [Pecten maximus]